MGKKAQLAGVIGRKALAPIAADRALPEQSQREKFVHGDETPVPIELSEVLADHKVQPREKIDRDTVHKYALKMRHQLEEGLDPADLVPALIVYVDGDRKYLAAGFHRMDAARQEKIKVLRATLRIGNLRDAILFALSDNEEHGLPLSNADKKRAVLRMLEDAEWGEWADRRIAKHCHVHHSTVAAHREELRQKRASTGGIRQSDEPQQPELQLESGSQGPAMAPQPPAQEPRRSRRGSDDIVRRLPERPRPAPAVAPEPSVEPEPEQPRPPSRPLPAPREEVVTARRLVDEVCQYFEGDLGLTRTEVIETILLPKVRALQVERFQQESRSFQDAPMEETTHGQ